MIDGTFEHSDSNGGGGRHHQRRHAVDDRRRRDPAHREAAGGARAQRRPVPRLPAVGQPAGRPEVGARRATRTSAPARSRCSHRPTAARSSASSPATWPGHAGPGSTYSPMTLVHATLSPGARLALPWRPDYNALVYVMAGQGTRRRRRPPDRERAARGARCRATRSPWPPARHQESRSPNLDVLILGGRPIREPVAWMGPFVMNTREEVMQAVADYQAGRLGSIPAVHGAPTTLTESAPAEHLVRLARGRADRRTAGPGHRGERPVSRRPPRPRDDRGRRRGDPPRPAVPCGPRRRMSERAGPGPRPGPRRWSVSSYRRTARRA